MKYFIHIYRAPFLTEDNVVIPESVGCVEIVSWKIEANSIVCVVPVPPERGSTPSRMATKASLREEFRKGSKLYIVENHGQYWEPNGDIIWSWADGFGDYPATAQAVGVLYRQPAMPGEAEARGRVGS